MMGTRRAAAGGKRPLLRTSKMYWSSTWSRIWSVLLVAAVSFGAPNLVTCRPDYIAELATTTRFTLPDRPMTANNDLITMPLTARESSAAETEITSSWDTSMGLAISSTAPTITTVRPKVTTTTRAAVTPATLATTTQSAQIGLTTKSTITAAAQTTEAVGVATKASTTRLETMLISTIYPTSAVDSTHLETATATAAVRLPAAMAATTEAEADGNNSIEMATLLASSEENAVLLLPHPGSADALTKGFSIPTFLPPFPVFAAADLPAYRAAAAAAEAAEAAAAAAAAAAASTAASETVVLSPEQQRQLLFNEQHLYLASHQAGQQTGLPVRRNLTMPVLNITVQMGNHAYMPCQIHRLSDKPVSWVRMRDGHIISVDETTFIADERFQSIFQEDNDYTWYLQIKYVRAADAGWYECQMATEPKLSAKVHLVIVTPKTELIGDQSRFVKAGSKVALHCIVRGTLDPPKYIIWFRGQKKVSESDEKTGWYTQIDRNIFGNVADNQNTIGSLIIPFVRKEDSGNYTCQPSNSASVSIDLHVLSGEYSASAIMSAAVRRTPLSTFQLLRILIGMMLLRLLALQRGMGVLSKT